MVLTLCPVKLSCPNFLVKWSWLNLSSEMVLTQFVQWNEPSRFSPVKWSSNNLSSEMILTQYVQWNDPDPICPVKWTWANLSCGMAVIQFVQWNCPHLICPVKWTCPNMSCEMVLTQIAFFYFILWTFLSLYGLGIWLWSTGHFVVLHFVTHLIQGWIKWFLL